MIDKNENIKNKLALLPDTPGVYQYFDKTGKIIYVGKAKNLKRRVSSYFNKVHDSPKTNILVKNIYDLQYIVVKTEEDALHLENSLIKAYKPRYNVLLKDDKTYPWICLRNEHFPRVFLTRKVYKDGSKYYGPYANVHLAKTVLGLIRELYPIRTCNYALTPENIEKNRFRVCLQYHIKNCKGCCVGKISEQEYNGYIEQVRQILNGDIHQLSNHLLEEMSALSAELRFEEAQVVKEKYDLIEKYKAKSVIVNPALHEIDVFSYDEDEGVAFVNYMHVRGGSIVQSITIEYKKKLDESASEILSLGIAELRSRFGSRAKEALVPFLPESDFVDLEFVVPQRGDKKKLLAVSEQNVKQYKVDRLKQSEKLNPEQRVMRILTRIQQDFRLPELPWHMECFDNSNIQGTNPVASCVVFKKAKPSKKDYRHFDIKTVVALESIDALGLRGKVSIVGIAKRLEEIYFPGDSLPLYIDKNSESLRVIQHMRDEAHRFGITFHRNKRSKGQVKSALDSIPGIGPKSRDLLLSHFKSVKRIKEASESDLMAVVGPAKAKIIKKYLI